MISEPVTCTSSCEVAAPPDHLVLVGEQPGYTTETGDGSRACPGPFFIRQMQFQVVSSDSNGAAPVGSVSVKETFDSVSSNTCAANMQPVASGCAPTTSSGTFIDSISVGCGSRNGPAGCGYNITWGWYWCGTANSGVVKLASLTAQVLRDSVTVNGCSSSWPAGTAFRP